MIHLLLKPIHLVSSIFFTFLLFACSSVPNTIQIQPEISATDSPPVISSDRTWSVSSQDRRIAHYLIEISTGDGPATLINESDSSHRIILQTLTNQWLAQGLTISPESDHTIDVQLIKLLAKVKQSTYKHEISSEVVIKVELHTNNKTFSKIFNARALSEAPFNADIEKISKQLNTQLSQLLSTMVNDVALNSALEKP